MSNDWAKDIHEMHSKFGVHEWFETNKNDVDLMSKYMRFRLKMCAEELNETIDAALFDCNPEEIVDGLIDLIVFSIGTLDVFGVDANKAWDEVYRANITKKVGVKTSRPNKLGLPDLIKPTKETHGYDWEAPNHYGNHGYLENAIKK